MVRALTHDSLTPTEKARIDLICAFVANPAAFRCVQDRAVDEDKRATEVLITLSEEIVAGVRSER